MDEMGLVFTGITCDYYVNKGIANVIKGGALGVSGFLATYIKQSYVQGVAYRLLGILGSQSIGNGI